MTKIKNKIRNWLQELIREATIDFPYKTSKETAYNLFAYVGIERMRKILDEKEKRGIEYTSLAELYCLTLRDNLEAENSDRMHAYYELLPKLDEYKKAFDLKGWEERKAKRFM